MDPESVLEMANYSFEKHFNKSIGSFPPRIVLREYLMGRFNSIKDKDIRYNTVVRNVEQKEETFLVTVENLTSNQRYSEIFDYVVVATGHFFDSKPSHIPRFRINLVAEFYTLMISEMLMNLKVKQFCLLVLVILLKI